MPASVVHLGGSSTRDARGSAPAWGQSDDGGAPVSEFLAESAGPLSPFGEDHDFPLPPSRLRYAHPTDKPNRAGVQAGE